MLGNFEFRSRTRIVFGPGEVARAGELVSEVAVEHPGDDDRPAERVLVVTDPGIVEAGHAGRVAGLLREAGFEVTVFDGVEENPTTRHVEAGTAAAREARAELLVAVGGGSAMDCAKGVNFLASCGGRMQDYEGLGRATGRMLPMVAIPTTSGTGSETQSFALVAEAESHRKMACGDRRAACRLALLDPELTVSQPRSVTAATGIDAISHAVESLVTKRRTPLSRTFSLEAWRLLEPSFERVLARADDLEARASMQLGAALAGLAIEHSMLGVAHSTANPLTARHRVVHGAAVGVMLPSVVRFNGAVVAEDYAELVSSERSRPTGTEAVEVLATRLEELLRASGLGNSLTEHGVSEGELEALAAQASTQWTAQFNPRIPTVEDLAELYRRAL